MSMNYLHRQKTSKAMQLLTLIALLVLLTACSSAGSFFGSNGRSALEPVQAVAGGDPLRGTLAIQSYGCGACHVVPGIAGANSLVGPPLVAWAERRYIAGKLPNQPEFLIEWIRFPQAIEPGSAMPNMGVTEQEARDISAYLYTLSDD